MSEPRANGATSIEDLPPVRQEAKRGPLAWFSDLSRLGQVLAILGILGTLALGLLGAGYASSRVTTDEELAVVVEEVKRIDGEVEQQFILHGIVETKVSNLEQRAEWQNEVLWRVVQDRGWDRGRDPLGPPPTPTPVVHTSATPTPEPTP